MAKKSKIKRDYNHKFCQHSVLIFIVCSKQVKIMTVDSKAGIEACNFNLVNIADVVSLYYENKSVWVHPP